MKKLLSLILLALVACGPSGQIATPRQNIAHQFKFEAHRFRPKWQWSQPGTSAILSLEQEGRGMVWSIREMPYADRRHLTFPSVMLPPYFPTEGHRGLQDVRFSPSGETILIHEISPDGLRSQTLAFRKSGPMSTWSAERINLAAPGKTKMRKLDDGTRVPALLTNPKPPRILRLDDNLVIYEVDGETRSATL
ncbi:MAG: hypothetical protein Q7Q71_10780 [Verrucomicrobiota bacterium JB023]|nr:hypothetical protein [Verrucomicrobiota bacterium JB023]